jgi:hypothetical protein
VGAVGIWASPALRGGGSPGKQRYDRSGGFFYKGLVFFSLSSFSLTVVR